MRHFKKIYPGILVLVINIVLGCSAKSAEPQHNLSILGEGRNGDLLYRGQESIEEALRFIGEPNETIKKLTIPYKDKLANEKQLAIAAKLIDIHKRRDVEAFKSLLCESNLKDMENPENRLNKIAEDIKNGQFLTPIEDVKFFAISRPFPADEFRSKGINFSEEPNVMLILCYYHKPKKMLIGNAYYLLESDESYKIIFSNPRYTGKQENDPNSITKTEEEKVIKAEELVWGLDVNGLRAAVHFIPEKESYSTGEIIKIRFYIQNVSSRNISFTTEQRRNDGTQCFLEDSQGKVLRCVNILYSGVPILVQKKLLPDEVTTIESASLGIAEDFKGAKRFSYHIGNEAAVKPGQYKLYYELRFPDVLRQNAWGETIFPKPEDWRGKLVTGKRNFIVTPRAKETPAAKAEGNMDVTAAEKWVRVLPDGNVVKLAAVFEPEKPDVFWGPYGETIKGPKLSEAQLASAAGSKLAVVFEVPKETEGQRAAADGKFYSVYGWGEIEPNKPLTASYGRGWKEWETIISTIYEGRAVPYQNQYFTLAKVEDKSSGGQKRILITMWYSENTDFGIRLVAVDRKGNKFPAEADDIWVGMPPKGVRAKYYKFANGLSKNELDHFEIQRRPMAWAVFTDFATTLKTTSVQAEVK